MALLITTSRRPSRRTRTFVKELNRVLPGSFKINRGKLGLNEIRDLMIKRGINKLLVVDTRKGNPSKLTFLSLSPEGLDRKLIIEVLGTALQINKKQRRLLSNILDIKVDGVPNELSKVLSYFLFPSTNLASSGVDGYLKIKLDNDVFTIEFLDKKGKQIYPLIKGRVVYYDSSGL
jgi:U3 small nucleolar ribonucleoprotein protein IMP4